MAGRISLQPHVSPEVESIVLWRDPKKSGALLVAATVAFWLLQSISLLRLACYALGTVTAATLVWQHGGAILGRPGPPVPAIFEGFSEESWSQLSNSIRPHVNVALNFLGLVVSGKNAMLSLKVMAVSFAAAYILYYVPLLSLAYTVVLLAFVLPKVYELRKDDADKLLAQAQSKAKELYAKVDDVLLKKIHHKAPLKQE